MGADQFVLTPVMIISQAVNFSGFSKSTELLTHEGVAMAIWM
jgi:hypothetical protein